MEPRYVIETSYHRWTCGDGCCSESGYSLELWDTEKNVLLFVKDDWSYQWDEDALIARGVEYLTEILDREPILNEDYEIDSPNDLTLIKTTIQLRHGKEI